VFAYLLIDYGPKPTGSILRCKAAGQQIRNFRHAMKSLESDISPMVFYDYSRTRTKLIHLPKLEGMLTRVKDNGGIILIDDFRRFFVKCDLKQRQNLFNELSSYAGHLRDFRTSKDIGDLSHAVARNILEVESPLQFSMVKASRLTMSADEKHQQTRKATRASQSVRADAANQKARELHMLKVELLKAREAITDTELASEAKKKGLTTTRGGQWSSSSVKRALKRIEGPPQG